MYAIILDTAKNSLKCKNYEILTAEERKNVISCYPQQKQAIQAAKSLKKKFDRGITA